MGNRGLEGPGLPPAQERGLTIAGWLALAVILFFCLRYDLLVRIYDTEPFFVVYIAIAAVSLGILALYGVMNTFRIIRRSSKRNDDDYIDVGWGGRFMTHYTKEDEADLCGLGDSGDGDWDIDAD